MRSSGVVRACLSAALALAVLFPATGHAVDPPADVTVDVATDGGSAADCELRDAITTLNENGAFDGCTETTNGEARSVIDFDIGADGSLHTIAVTGTPLPVIEVPVEIDGRNGGSQIEIQLDGSALATATNNGLVLFPGSDGSYLHHLAVHSFPNDGFLSSSGSNLLEQVIAGTNRAATTDLGNGGDGIQIEGDDTTVNASLVSANTRNGIEIIPSPLQDATASGTTITGSVIGMNGTGTAPLANSLDGIHANLGANVEVGGDAADITIGGSDPIGATASCPALPIGTGDCNLISGNGDAGIDITVSNSGPFRATGLTISGNYVGTTADGLAAGDTAVVPGSCSVQPAGIKLGGAVEAPAISGNLVSGNTGKGITLGPAPGASSDIGVHGASVTGNIVGLDRDGDLPVGNQCAGVELSATIAPDPGDPLTEVAGNVIGGPDAGPGSGCDGDCNVISANGSAGDDGISIAGRVTDTSVLGNFIGTDISGAEARPNTQSGVAVSPFEYETGDEAGTIGSPAAPNVISGNTLDGVKAAWADADPAPGPINLAVQSNLIGLAADGVTAMANGDSGVEIWGGGTAGVTVGGLTAALGNTIAHNVEDGVTIVGHPTDPADDNPILGNSIFANELLGIDLRPESLTDGVTENGDCSPASPNDCQPFPLLRAAAAGSAAVAGELEAGPSTSYRIELFANSAADPSGNGEGERLLGALTVTTDAGGSAEWLFADPAGDLADGEFVTATATSLSGLGAALSTSEFSEALATPTCDVPGSPLADALAGGAGDEIVCGFAGADTVAGGAGRDALFGGLGNDTLDARDGEADALIDCGGGTDTVEADSLALDPAALFVGCETIERPATDPPDPPPDTTAPQLTAEADKKQKSKKKILVEATCEDEACDLEATGTIKVKILDRKGKVKKKKTYDLEPASAEDVAAGRRTTLKLKFDDKTKKKIEKVIKLKKSKAKAYVTATDAAGNVSEAPKLKITVKK
jgi:hypothetical protein